MKLASFAIGSNMEDRFTAIPNIRINDETCVKCGLCSKICPVRVFNYRQGEVPVTQNNEECVLCGQCICGCTTDSIIHSGFDKNKFLKKSNSHRVSPETAFEFLAQRRSLRNYRVDVPSQELLEKVISIAGYAPGGHHHRVGWIRNATVVYGHENMKRITETTVDYVEAMLKLLKGWFMKFAARYDDRAKAAAAVVPSFEISLNEYKAGNNLITYNAPAAIFLHAPMSSSTPQEDCDSACMLIQLYAEANGLGTCWNGLIRDAAAGEHLKKFTKMAEFLKIPDGHKCYAAMTLGFPSIKLHSIPERKTEITWRDANCRDGIVVSPVQFRVESAITIDRS
ncbi:MAG: nitroreductase family protein [Chloroflexi bacterium]|nr:nitroreductase family protein [Chloroflexota bacterium]